MNDYFVLESINLRLISLKKNMNLKTVIGLLKRTTGSTTTISQPKRNPRVGGSTITVHEQKYSFGALAYQFYYSGELNEIFPIRNKKFDWHE